MCERELPDPYTHLAVKLTASFRQMTWLEAALNSSCMRPDLMEGPIPIT